LKEQSFKKKRIAVLMGGLSREREISLKTGQAILKALLAKGYNATSIDVDRDVAERVVKQKVECAFIALHGRFGEDGTIQGLLELMEIPYTGSGVLASAIALHKVMTKKILHYEKIPTPFFEVFYRREVGEDILKKISLPLPVVIKPAQEGSTIGVSIVREERELCSSLKRASQYDEEILVEEFMKGKEITVSILGELPLPIIEIVPKGGFYDYHSKYTKGETQYIIPARIPREKYLSAQEVSVKAYKALGCSGCVRVDLMTDENDSPFVVDVNTMPGMTETSLVPKAAAYAGIAFEDLVERILLGASLKIERGSITHKRLKFVSLRKLHYAFCYFLTGGGSVTIRGGHFFRPKQRPEARGGERLQEIFGKAIRTVSYLLLLSFFLFLGHRVYAHLLASPSFRVREVEVKGSQRIPKETLLSLASLEGMPNLFTLRLREVVQHIESHPWIEKVGARKVFPDKLVIEVEERKPIAILQLEDLYYIDAKGVIFSVVGDGEGYNYPFVTGMNRQALERDSEEAKRFVLKALELLLTCEKKKLVPPEEISEIHVEKGSGIQFIIKSGGVKVYVGWDDFEEKLKRLSMIRADLQKRGWSAVSIDCSDLNRMVVKKASERSQLGRR
jgi:D-alanine-D-alanine ligase